MARERKVKEKTRKKIVLIIVEGITEIIALEVALNDFFEKKYGEEGKNGDDVLVFYALRQNGDEPPGGDITSAYGVNPKTIQMVMNKTILMPCIMDNNLMPKYITEVIHIIDTDGTFIPSSAVQPINDSDKETHHVYTDNGILTDDVAGILERNKNKSANIAALLRLHQTGITLQNYIDTGRGNKPTTKGTIVPYSIFFFSSNLDHVICNDANLPTSHHKKAAAREFASNHGQSYQRLSAFFRNSEGVSLNMPYNDSWSFIQQGLNSIQKHTNLDDLFWQDNSTAI